MRKAPLFDWAVGQDAEFATGYLAVELPSRQWAKLMNWLSVSTAHTKHGDKGGFQARRVAWRESVMDSVRSTGDRKILLGGPDIQFVRQCIRKRNKGDFERKVSDIFEDAHRLFTGLVIEPKKR